MTRIFVFTLQEMLIFLEALYSFVYYFITRYFITTCKSLLIDQLRAKRNPFYLKAQVVPRSKPLPPRV